MENFASFQHKRQYLFAKDTAQGQVYHDHDSLDVDIMTSTIDFRE